MNIATLYKGEKTMSLDDYKEEISKMNNDELKVETKEKIWSSTFWVRVSHESHSQVDACYAEWNKRDGNSSTYKRLHQEVRKEFSN